MENKRKFNKWLLIVIHYLIAGYAVPFFITFVLAGPFFFLRGAKIMEISEIISSNMMQFAWLIGICLGSIYSAKFFSKRYIILNKGMIVFLSTILLIIFNGWSRFSVLLRGEDGISVPYLVNFTFFVISIICFYIFSKKNFINNSN